MNDELIFVAGFCKFAVARLEPRFWLPVVTNVHKAIRAFTAFQAVAENNGVFSRSSWVDQSWFDRVEGWRSHDCSRLSSSNGSLRVKKSEGPTAPSLLGLVCLGSLPGLRFALEQTSQSASFGRSLPNSPGPSRITSYQQQWVMDK